MANRDLKNTLDRILSTIEKSRGGVKGKGGKSKTARQTIQKDPTAQFFILHEPTIYEEIDSIGFDKDLLKANGGEENALPVLSKAEKKRVLDAFETGYLKNAHVRTKYPTTPKGVSTKGRFEVQLAKLKTIYSGPEFRVYIVGKYDTVRRNKKDLFVRELEKVWKELGASKAAYTEMAERAGGASPKGGGKADIGFQLGHGEYGIASSEITGARGESRYEKEKRALSKPGAKATKKGLKAVDDIFLEYRSNFNANLKHNNIVTQKGDLRKNFFITLSFQKSASNQADASDIEAAALDTLVKDLKTQRKLVEGDTSISLRDCLTSVLSEALTSKTRRALATKGIKIRYRGHRPKKQIKQKGTGNTRGSLKFGNKVKIGTGPSLIKLGVAKALNVNKLNKNTAAAGSKSKVTSPIATLNYINKSLAEELQKNMQSPGLVNRTGRFADSVRAIKMIPAKGRRWPVLQYTYDRDPYGVFELGGGDRRWASKARDPRTLIGKTIREMAREQALGRFTTQRI